MNYSLLNRLISYKICNEYGIKKPKFEEVFNGFMVTLFKEKLKENNNDTDNDTDRGQIIINLIKNDSKITISQLAKKLMVSRSTILREIKDLKVNGRLKRIGKEKGGYWVIKLLNKK